MPPRKYSNPPVLSLTAQSVLRRCREMNVSPQAVLAEFLFKSGNVFEFGDPVSLPSSDRDGKPTCDILEKLEYRPEWYPFFRGYGRAEAFRGDEFTLHDRDEKGRDAFYLRDGDMKVVLEAMGKERFGPQTIQVLYDTVGYLDKIRAEDHADVSSYRNLREAAANDADLVAFLGSSGNVREAFRRAEYYYPRGGISILPMVLDREANSKVFDCARLSSMLLGESSLALPLDERAGILDTLDRLLSGLGGREFTRYQGLREYRLGFVPDEMRVRDVFLFNGKHCFAGEVESMYDNAWIVEGRRVASYGPYCCPALAKVGWDTGPRPVDDPDAYRVGVQESGHGGSLLGDASGRTFEVFSDRGNIILKDLTSVKIVQPSRESGSYTMLEVTTKDGRREMYGPNELRRLDDDAEKVRIAGLKASKAHRFFVHKEKKRAVRVHL